MRESDFALYSVIGTRLKEIRLGAGYDIAEVSKETGVSQSRISEAENLSNKTDIDAVKQKITLSNLIQLCEFYGVALDFIVGLSDCKEEARYTSIFLKKAHQIGQDYLLHAISQSAITLRDSIENRDILDRLLEEVESVLLDSAELLKLNQEWQKLNYSDTFHYSLMELQSIYNDAISTLNHRDSKKTLSLQDLCGAIKNGDSRLSMHQSIDGTHERLMLTKSRMNDFYESLADKVESPGFKQLGLFDGNS